MIRCNKCGADNLDNSKFCGNCGAPIENHNELYKCSKCGGRIHNKQSFCNKCGSKLIYSEDENEAFAIPVSNKPHEHHINNKATKIVFAALCAFVSFLVMISIFLPPVMMVGKSGFDARLTEHLQIDYWFYDCWAEFDNCSNYFKALTIINFMSFITAIGLVFPFAIIGIIKSIKAITHKEDFTSTKYVAFALVGAMQYFLLTYVNFAESIDDSTSSLSTHPSAGFIIAIISVFIFVGALIFKSIVQYKEEHSSSLRCLIIKLILLVLVSCTTLFSFGTAFGVVIAEPYKIESSIYSIMVNLSSANIEITKVLTILAYILQISLVSFALCSLGVSLTSKKPINITFPIIMLAGFIVFGVLSIHAYGNYQADLEIASDARLQEIIRGTKFGTPTIVGIVFSTLTLAASIVSLVFNKKESE